jgi:hypothetical protein
MTPACSGANDAYRFDAGTLTSTWTGDPFRASANTRLALERTTPTEDQTMSRRTAVANGADPVQRKAAADANLVQDGVNLVAIVGCFHRHLLALSRSGVGGDDLINHPVSLAFVSKLNSLCRMNLDREMAAFEHVERIEKGESVEYEVIPL